MNPVDEPDVFGLTGTTLEGRYIIECAVAEGGFGVVYRAQQAALGRPVAVKVLKTPTHFDAAAKQHFLASFAQEARTIARMTHPNIVLVHDFGVSEMPSRQRAAWMVLEWVTGETLDDELRRRRGRGGRTPAECLSLLKPALSALAVVHAAGVAHRDLKPANIMLVATAGGLGLKLLDFGIAKMMDADEMPGTGDTRTRSSQVAFSPGYASPEQIRRGRSGPWTDVHAMGLILTEMLTDRPPLDGATMALLFEQVADRVRPTPAKFGVAVGAWEAVLCRAMALSPAERYRDATELLHALETTVPSIVREAFEDTAAAVPVQPARASTLSNSHVTKNSPSQDVALVRPESGGTRRPLRERLEEPRGARPLSLVVAAAATMAAAWFGWHAMAMRSAAPTADSPGDTASAATTRAITIESVPQGAYVVEENQVLGTTPMTLMLDTSAAKERHLEMSLPGYAPFMFVPLANGGSIRVQLAPLNIGAAPVTNHPTAITTHPGTPSAAASSRDILSLLDTPDTQDRSPARLPPDGVGYFTFDTYPPTRVTEGGAQVGMTPLVHVPLSAGVHNLMLDNPDQGIHEGYPVTIRAGESMTKRLGLK